jgi:hypothetical protein
MLTLRHLLRPTLCVASVLTLTGCGASRAVGDLQVRLTRECLRLGGTVKPPEIDANSDYRKLSADALGRLQQANRGSAARTRCEQRVIANYANGSPLK